MGRTASFCRTAHRDFGRNGASESGGSLPDVGCGTRCTYEKWGRYCYRPHSRRHVASTLQPTTWHRRLVAFALRLSRLCRTALAPASGSVGGDPASANRGFVHAISCRFAVPRPSSPFGLAPAVRFPCRGRAACPPVRPPASCRQKTTIPPGPCGSGAYPALMTVRCLSRVRPECPAFDRRIVS